VRLASLALLLIAVPLLLIGHAGLRDQSQGRVGLLLLGLLGAMILLVPVTIRALVGLQREKERGEMTAGEQTGEFAKRFLLSLAVAVLTCFTASTVFSIVFAVGFFAVCTGSLVVAGEGASSRGGENAMLYGLIGGAILGGVGAIGLAALLWRAFWPRR
jgi:hypothetical protein